MEAGSKVSLARDSTPRGPILKRWAAALLVSFAVVVCSFSTSPARERLLFGVHPYKPAAELEFMFAPLTAYLSSITGKPVALRVAKSYEEHIDQIGKGKVDIAFMGSGSYVEMVGRYGRKPLLARFEISRMPTYYGVIMVPRESPVKLLKDLKGKRVAFSDRQSTSGYIIPRYMFHKAGISLQNLDEYTFMGNHNNVALGVLFGDYDAGAVEEEVFNKYEHRGLRILALTPPISESVFVTGGTLSENTVESLRRGLWQLKDTPEGGSIMRVMKPTLTALVPVEDSDYENLRTILRELKDEGIVP